MSDDPCAAIKQLIQSDDHEAVRRHLGCFDKSFIARFAGQCLAENTVRMLFLEKMLIFEERWRKRQCNTDAHGELVKALLTTNDGLALLEQMDREICFREDDQCKHCLESEGHLNKDWFAPALVAAMTKGDCKQLKHIRQSFFDDPEFITDIVCNNEDMFFQAWTTCPPETAEWLTNNTHLTNVHVKAKTPDSVINFNDAFSNETGHLCTTGLGKVLIQRTRALPYQVLQDIWFIAIVQEPDHSTPLKCQWVFWGAVWSLCPIVLTQAVIQCCLRKKSKSVFKLSWLHESLTWLQENVQRYIVDANPLVCTLRRALGINLDKLDEAYAAMRAELIKLRDCSSISHVVRYMSCKTWIKTRVLLLTRNRLAHKGRETLPHLPNELWEIIIVFFSFSERPFVK
jgi:hypothetical protein